jgi:hypothetical protein
MISTLNPFGEQNITEGSMCLVRKGPQEATGLAGGLFVPLISSCDGENEFGLPKLMTGLRLLIYPKLQLINHF